MRKLLSATTLLVLLSFAVVSTASAGEGDIKYRQDIMKTQAGHMRAIVMILKGQGGHKADLAKHAQAIADLSDIAQGIFPPDSSMKAGKTAALDAIWSKPDEFKAVLTTYNAEAKKLAEVAKTGDMAAIGAQLGVLGKKGCGGCHKNFRKKDDD